MTNAFTTLEQQLLDNTDMNQALLERLSGGPISVVLDHQSLDGDWLRRRVKLVGQGSTHTYCLGFASVFLPAVPDGVRAGLDAGQVGLGVLLDKAAMPTRRQIDKKWRTADGLPARRYRILSGDQLLCEIEEHFQLDDIRTASRQSTLQKAM